MSAATIDHTVMPPSESLTRLASLLSQTAVCPAARLVGPNGEQVALPPELFVVLRDVVGAMAHGHAVTIMPVHKRLTTQEAADLLDISRPTFVKLLESGEIPYEQPGRHRRVLLTDIIEYRQRRSSRRQKALDRMVEIANESGLYELTATPRRTR